MRPVLLALTLVLLVSPGLVACGGDQPAATPDDDSAATKKEGPGTIAELSRDPSKATPIEPPKPVDPEVAFYEKVDKLMASSDPEDRAGAVEMLRGAKNAAKAGPLAAKLVLDKDADVQYLAIEVVGELKYSAGVTSLRTALNSTDSSLVKKAVLSSLVLLQGDKAVEDLERAALEDEDDQIRVTAVKLLAEMKGDKPVTVLTKVLKDDFASAVRQEAVMAILKLKAAAAEDALIAALQDVDVVVREQSARALGAIKSKKAVRELMKIVRGWEDEEESVVLQVTKALAEITDVPNEYETEGTEEERKEALDAWLGWWEENKADYP